MKVKLTKRRVEALDRGTLWDSELPGFGVRLRSSGERYYFLKYRAHGRQRWLTIGRHGDLTADQARTEALALRGDVAKRKDPGEQRDRAKTVPTLEQFAERYLAEHARPKKKPATVTEDERNLRLHLIPKLGTQRMDRVSNADVARFHAARRAHPFNANRCLALLSHMFTMAAKWGVLRRPTNPCRGVERFPESHRERFLSDQELARLADAIAAAEQTDAASPFALAALRLLILTGARKSEILTLRWEYVDLQRGLLALPDSKTRQKTIWLNAPARQVLATLPRIEGSPWVIAGGRRGEHLHGLESTWRSVRSDAGLGGQDGRAPVRLHDLRHTFASVAIASGQSLPMIGALLGHKSLVTTQRYAHLANDPVMAANDEAGRRLAAAMSLATKPRRTKRRA